MNYTELKTTEFTQRLASADAVPGGGGASALAGALGAALGSMVANLTVNKKKYAEFREEIADLLEKCDALSKELLELVNLDAEYEEQEEQAQIDAAEEYRDIMEDD